MVLAAFVFMHRMAGLASMDGQSIIETDQADLPPGQRPRYLPNHGLPDDIAVLTFRGPLFSAAPVFSRTRWTGSGPASGSTSCVWKTCRCSIQPGPSPSATC